MEKVCVIRRDQPEIEFLAKPSKQVEKLVSSAPCPVLTIRAEA